MAMRTTNPLTPRRLVAPLALLVALAAPALARADANAVIQDCAKDGQLDGNYSNSDLKKARAQLPSDLDEYTDCRDAITARIAQNKRQPRDRAGGQQNGTSPPFATG